MRTEQPRSQTSIIYGGTGVDTGIQAESAGQNTFQAPDQQRSQGFKPTLDVTLGSQDLVSGPGSGCLPSMLTDHEQE
jgi:hypothetical protein